MADRNERGKVEQPEDKVSPIWRSERQERGRRPVTPWVPALRRDEPVRDLAFGDEDDDWADDEVDSPGSRTTH